MEGFSALNERIKRLNLWDLKLLQISAIFVGIIILKLIKPLLNIYDINIAWFILFAVILGIWPCYVVFRRT